MITDRTNVAVLPDVSKFQPALARYLQRLDTTVTAEIEIDDGFLSKMERDVAAAVRRVDAQVPLTADGERTRRVVRERAARVRSRLAALALDTPLDLDAAALARADVAAEVAELEGITEGSSIAVGINVEGEGESVRPGLSPGIVAGAVQFAGRAVSVGASMLAQLAQLVSAAGRAGPVGLAVAGALVTAALVAAVTIVAVLPALLSTFVLPVGVVALGWDGIAKAAKEAQPGFMALKNSVSAELAQSLAPAFRDLGDALPKLIPSFTALAGALSGAFSEVIGSLTSDKGIEKISGVIDNITLAVGILAPAMAPAVSTFLDLALSGMQVFVDGAPSLLTALEFMGGVMAQFIDSPLGGALLQLFTTAVTAGALLLGAAASGLVVLAAIRTWGDALSHTVALHVGAVILDPRPLMAKVASLPGLILGALAGLGALLSQLVTSALTSATTAAGSGVSSVVAVIGSLPALALAALSTLAGLLSGAVTGAMSLAKSAAGTGVSTIVSTVGALPGLVIAGIRALPSALSSVVTTATASLASGVGSGLALLTGVMASIVARIAAHFPGSPVKVGPLTAWNYAGGTEAAGRRLINDLARGMDAGRWGVGLSASRVAEVVAGMDLQRKGYDRETGQPLRFTTQRTPGAGSTVKDMEQAIYAAVHAGTAGKRRPATVSPRRGNE